MAAIKYSMTMKCVSFEPPSSYSHQTSMMPFFCLRVNRVTLLRISLGNGLPAGSVYRFSREPFFFILRSTSPRCCSSAWPSLSEPLEASRFNVGVPGGVRSELLPAIPMGVSIRPN